jgi:beta-glucosidase
MTDLTAAADGAGIKASFTVRNTGAVQGKAVPQVYVAGAGWEAPRRLGAFTKVDLAPGASQQVSVSIDPRLLATFDVASHSWKIAAGTYTVSLAASAADSVASTKVQVAAATLPGSAR